MRHSVFLHMLKMDLFRPFYFHFCTSEFALRKPITFYDAEKSKSFSTAEKSSLFACLQRDHRQRGIQRGPFGEFQSYWKLKVKKLSQNNLSRSSESYLSSHRIVAAFERSTQNCPKSKLLGIFESPLPSKKTSFKIGFWYHYLMSWKIKDQKKPGEEECIKIGRRIYDNSQNWTKNAQRA